MKQDNAFTFPHSYLLSLLFLFLTAADSYSQELLQIENFGKNPGNLKMFIHVPPSADTASGKALVLVLHGCMQNAKNVSEQTGWNKLADANGFLLVYPEQQFFNNPQRCFCWYRSGDIHKGMGEDASIKEMVDYMKSRYAIDSGRIFITGLSAGAAMSVVLMATYPSTFCAGAVFAGGPYNGAGNVFSSLSLMAGRIEYTPEQWAEKVQLQNPGYKGSYPKMIIYQGENDLVVNKKCGLELLKQWTALKQADSLLSRKTDRFADNPDIEKTIFFDAGLKEAVLYYKVKKLGHALLIHPGSCPNQGGKLLAFSEDRNYHSTWWTAFDFGLVHTEYITGQSEVGKDEQNLNYSVPGHEKSSYNWTYPAGCEIKSGAGTHSLFLDWGKQSGSINLAETDSSGCLFQYPTVFIQVRDQQ